MARRKNISVVLRKRNIQRSENAVLKKGMELPINTLVIVAIAVIVILAVAAFFMGGFGGSSKEVQNRQAFLNACAPWTQTGCSEAEDIENIRTAFITWQPSKADEDGNLIVPEGQDEMDYLAWMCGCFGAGSEPRSSTTGAGGGQ